MKHLKTILLLLSASGLLAQQLNQYMQEVREGSYKPIPSQILDASDQTALFNKLEPYFSDTLKIIKSKVYYIY